MKNIIIIISILFCAIISAQDPILEEKAFLKDSRVNSITKTKDGDFILTGYFKGIIDYEDTEYIWYRRLFITKLDKEGGVLWTKIFTNKNETKNDVYGKSIVEVAAGYMMLEISKYHKERLIKVDYSGNLIWKKDMNSASRLMSSYDGGVIATGNFENGNVWIYKLTDDGDIQWKISQKQFKIEKLIDLKKTIDKQYIALVIIKDDNNSSTYAFVKFNENGLITGQKKISNETFPMDSISMFSQDKSGNYIIITSVYFKRSCNIGITKLDDQGNVLFSKLYGLVQGEHESKHFYEYVSTMNEAENGGYVFGGVFRISSSYSNSYGSLFRIDDQGRFLWEKKFDINKYTRAQYLRPIEGNKYLLILNSDRNDDNNLLVGINVITDNFDAKYNPLLCPEEVEVE